MVIMMSATLLAQVPIAKLEDRKTGSNSEVTTQMGELKKVAKNIE